MQLEYEKIEETNQKNNISIQQTTTDGLTSAKTK